MSNSELGSIYYQKAWYDENAHQLPFLNSALFFGESTFTTMRVIGGEVLYLNYHLDRLNRSLHYLFEEVSEQLWEQIQAELELVAKAKGEGYLRLTFFKAPEDVSYFFYHRHFVTPLHQNPSLTLTRSKGRRGQSIRPTYLKVGDYLDTHQELKIAADEGFSEIVFLAADETILECASSNIFWVEEDQIYTPALRSGVLEGVMRRAVIAALKHSRWPVNLGDYKVDKLKTASEVWTSNALRGLTPVSSFEQTNYASRKVFNEVIGILRDFSS